MGLNFPSWVVLLFFSFFSVYFFPQSNNLQTAIGFTENGRQRAIDTAVVLDSISFPDDVSRSKLMYMDINKQNLLGNKTWYSRSAKRLNKKICKGMTEGYHGYFKVFLNNKMIKNINYFVNDGYNYRLFIRSTWKVHYEIDENQSFKVMYDETVHYKNTGKINGDGVWKYRNNFIQELLSRCCSNYLYKKER